MRMSTTTLALIVLICTLLFGCIIVSRSYSEGFEVDASGNQIPSPNTPTNQPPVQNVAPQFRSLMLEPLGQPMMAPQGQPMMAPQGQPMMAPKLPYDYSNGYAGQPMMMDPQGPPLMPPMALPMDAHIMLPIQSPVFARSRVNNLQMGAPYQNAQFIQNPGEQIPNISTPEVLNQQTMLLDQSKQAASRGDMAAAVSLKQAASQIGRG